MNISCLDKLSTINAIFGLFHYFKPNWHRKTHFTNAQPSVHPIWTRWMPVIITWLIYDHICRLKLAKMVIFTYANQYYTQTGLDECMFSIILLIYYIIYMINWPKWPFFTILPLFWAAMGSNIFFISLIPCQLARNYS